MKESLLLFCYLCLIFYLYRLMKHLFTTICLLTVCLLVGCKTSNTPDKNIEMLHAFYKAYIVEQSKVSNDALAKIDSLKNSYCSAELLAQISRLELDYDPFLSAQDCDEGYLDRMSIGKVEEKAHIYQVVFNDSIINPNYKNREIQLKVLEGRITDILGVTDSEALAAANDATEKNDSETEIDDRAMLNAHNLVPILIPGGRYEVGTIEKNIDESWMELYRDSVTGKYHISKAKYSIETYYDECLGENQGSLTSLREGLFFINMPTLKMGVIDSIDIGTGYAAPDRNLTITFNGSHYTLRVTAEVSDDEFHPFDQDQEYGYWKNYRMTLRKDNLSEVPLFDIKEFSNSVLRLLFAGDIDGDGKLDLVFDSHEWYESVAVTVFLSSIAPNGIIVKAGVAELSYDC